MILSIYPTSLDRTGPFGAKWQNKDDNPDDAPDNPGDRRMCGLPLKDFLVDLDRRCPFCQCRSASDRQHDLSERRAEGSQLRVMGGSYGTARQASAGPSAPDITAKDGSLKLES